MCGIFACHCHPDVKKFKPTALRLSKAIRHRGPDWSGSVISNNTILCHERLSIVGTESGAQPLTNADESIILAVNGEIYNHRLIRKGLTNPYHFKTTSDCEVIIPLYMQYGIDAPKYLDGMFSFVLYDKNLDRTIAARDPIGITTFYQGWSSKEPGTVYFASELKSLHPVCDKIEAFPPGHIFDSKTNERTRYFEPSWWDGSKTPDTPLDLKLLRETLERSVRKRLMAEVPYGVLLSGGLDSSLVASIAQRETLRLRKLAEAAGEDAEQKPEEQDRGEGLVGIDDDNQLSTMTFLPQLNSFSIGLPGSPDNKAALEVAKFLGTKHHVMTFTIEDGLNALSDVIYHLETYDVTTIRASTPMYLLSRKIKAMGIKMVLSGEGSDEIFGGYLYFHNAPDRAEFHDECVRRVKNLHLADCLRANKSTSAWGLEARVPFLDKRFLEVAMDIDPKEKMITKERIEKYILRKAFDTSDDPDAEPYLPEKILWRQKEQFSDGVGYGWIDSLKDHAEIHVTDEMMKNPKPEWGSDIPDTKEAYWYRCMFDEHFPPSCASTVMRWTPKWSAQTDPSGRYDFYHLSAGTLEVKSNTPNNVAFKVTGKSSHDKVTSGATWNTANALESKLELADSLAKGLKAEGIFSFLPAAQARGAKFNLHFKQPNFHGRAFFDLLKGPTANVDAVIGHEGFLAGASAGYDVQQGKVTGYSAAVGYLAPTYTAAVTATDNLSVFAASYYHKVNSQVEAGAKATWNSKSGSTVGLEVASKYRLDPVSFVKGKINDRGVAAVAYNVLLREGVTFGIGASFDTQKLDQATHKVGTSFTFES
ncbi:hypothetical protein QBC33DRAFT_444709 [Phialemonium atrogriseum]|uniref:asparagine synthase (glutamine-hydrolyzing) n=1 Tax=Phialemonium atrogriseum TaxID=1093897 RepID=A0AAJ0C6N0_9PEZI|nr:uncharacterized protein QBC33DRAFT_444709 [Phialemonium atrogriseum]KAK1771140.1 hypothetical protein QBC33DRAFT_444709 [Phialemonium atrogriseum]